MRRFYFFAFCLLIFAFLCGCQNQRLYRDSRIMMGTFVEVISPDRDAADIAFAEIRRLENILSKYKDDSEVAKLNQYGEINASPELFYVLKEAKKFWEASGGAFDITVGPLMDLWGFTDKKFRKPDEAEIKKTLEVIGSNKIVLNFENNVVKFMLPGMKIDLGAIAKGFAVDCAIKKIKEAGIRSCLVNAGGDIYCLGSKFGKPWNVAVQNPRGRDFKENLELEDKAVATSGDYEQYFMVQESIRPFPIPLRKSHFKVIAEGDFLVKDKKRYTHILNPKTGYPANRGVVSVTVIAPDCLTADALATSIFVLGKKKGLELIKNFLDIEVEIIEKEAQE